VAALMLVMGILTRAPVMAIPACIVGGIGSLLYYQNLSGNWASWAYAWALIPGFVGVGLVLSGVLGNGRLRDALSGGAWLLFISLVLFVVFGSFLGGLNIIGAYWVYWPALLIVLGVVFLVRSFRRVGN
jgi:hypothetical protein